MERNKHEDIERQAETDRSEFMNRQRQKQRQKCRDRVTETETDTDRQRQSQADSLILKDS